MPDEIEIWHGEAERPADGNGFVGASPSLSRPSDIKGTPDLRPALRKLAKAVIIVSAQRDGIPFAMSATAVSEVSLDPPTMLVCVNRRASIHAAIVESGTFCLNILSDKHEEISWRCGGGVAASDRLKVGDWTRDPHGNPVLADAEASIVCSLIKTSSIGTHDIFVGEVTQVETSSGCDPLIYVDGAYGRAFRRTAPQQNRA